MIRIAELMIYLYPMILPRCFFGGYSPCAPRRNGIFYPTDRSGKYPIWYMNHQNKIE
jgi:hypothetical protein